MKRIFLALAALAAGTLIFLTIGCSGERPCAPVEGDTPSDPAAPLASLTSVPDTLTFVETFTTGRNEGNWSYYTTHSPVIEDAGGNPDEYLHDDNVVSFAPHPGTALGDRSDFTGDYRARRVVSLGIDLRSLNYTWDITSRYVALMIMKDGGTPLDPQDDWGAFIIGPDKVPSKAVEMKNAADKNAPGWKSYDFVIPSQTNRLPEGWTIIRPESGNWDKARATWGNLMTDVSYVQFWYGDPTSIYLLNDFDLGLDNPRISWEILE